MQKVVKSFIFAFLVCSVTSDQDCRREDILFPYVQKSALDESYSSGKTVRVNCETGYVGFLKLSCANGTWKKDGGRDCKRRPCGHPGDTPNGDFELTGETEFVFGAVVKYTCRTGYVMASRINSRICRSQGWDNSVPICEVVRCPAIQTSGAVLAIGNTEEASYDDVVNFECSSNNLMLDGPKDIHCKEDGTWSASVPKCKEIECEPPEINHGTILEKKTRYKENEALKYECNENYRQRQGIPRCLRNGWSITPQCEEINCLLLHSTTGIKSTKPEGKNLFKPGERVEITCSKSYWLSIVKKQTAWIRCKENGHWESPAACEAIGCEIPYGQNVYWPTRSFSGDRRLGVITTYSCDYGYKQAAGQATCTENGWTPNPLCIEHGCPAPTIENTKPLRNPKPKYRRGDRIQVQCLAGYEPERLDLYCNYEDLWDFRGSCTVKPGTVQRCNSFKLTNGYTHYPTTKTGPPSQSIYYSCDQNHKPSEEGWWGQKSCRNGVLVDQPKCIRMNDCVGLPNIPHAKPIQASIDIFRDQDWKHFECDFGFRRSPDYIRCLNGQWEAAQCEEKCGHPPPVENAVVLPSSPPSENAQWSTVTYKCRETFEMHGRDTIRCTKSGWGNAPTCELPSGACESPAEEINNGTIKDTSMVKDYYSRNTHVEYKCSEGFEFSQNERFALCSGGSWTYPTCLPSPPSNPNEEEEETQPKKESSAGHETVVQGEPGDCGPPKQITGAVQESKAKYKNGEIATYECPAYFIKDGDPHLTCINGKWSGNGKCLQPCTADVYQMEPRHIILKREDLSKIYAKHGEFLTFRCQRGYKHDGEITLRQQCLDGKIDLPLCVKCPEDNC